MVIYLKIYGPVIYLKIGGYGIFNPPDHGTTGYGSYGFV